MTGAHNVPVDIIQLGPSKKHDSYIKAFTVYFEYHWSTIKGSMSGSNNGPVTVSKHCCLNKYCTRVVVFTLSFK